MQTIINILVFFVILGAIVLIHELGHFLTAKLFGVYCAEFSIGMGPKLFSKKKGETDYQIRALPIGGYVAMAGEADQEDNELMKDVPYERTLKGIKTWKKCVIMLAGVFMNFVLALVLLIGIYSFVEVQTNTSEIGSVVENNGAYNAGIQAGDTINKITINGEEHIIASFSDIQSVLSNENFVVVPEESETISFHIEDKQKRIVFICDKEWRKWDFKFLGIDKDSNITISTADMGDEYYRYNGETWIYNSESTGDGNVPLTEK